MNIARKIIQYFFLIYIIYQLPAFADEKVDSIQLIKNLYREDVKTLLCTDPDGEQNSKLISVVEIYFTSDFIRYYRPSVCESYFIDWRGDPRTGEPGSFPYEDSKAKFFNLKIDTPIISGNKTRVRTTYDFPDLSYKNYGNFTLFTLIKENGLWKIDDIELGGHDLDKYNEREDKSGMKPIKSLKRLIKKEMEIKKIQ